MQRSGPFPHIFGHSMSVSAQGLTSMCLCMKNSLGGMLSFAFEAMLFLEHYSIAIEDTEGSSLRKVRHCPCTLSILLKGLSQTSWLYIHTGSWVADSGWGNALFDMFLSLFVSCCHLLWLEDFRTAGALPSKSDAWPKRVAVNIC